jgi:hypothetical protein
VPRIGLEETAENLGNSQAVPQGGTKGGARRSDFESPKCAGGSEGAGDSDPDLATVMAAWPALSAAMRAQVLALVRGQSDVATD